MEILETKERKMNKIKREEREDLHTFSDTTLAAAAYNFKRAMRVLLYLIKRISIELVSTSFILKYSF